MPFYEYECKSCGHALEAMQKVNDAPLKKCPSCGKSQLMRLMSAPVFRLKGAGWYETDFKGEQDHKKNLAERPEPEAAKDDKADAKGVEAKSGDAGKDKPAGDKAEKADKPAEKPAASTAVDSKKAAPAISKRGSAALKSLAKKPVKPAKKPAPKAKRRA